MKTRHKKLTVARTTIRALTDQQLGDVGGATTIIIVVTSTATLSIPLACSLYCQLPEPTKVVKKA
jgi:hypothetical protein